MLSVYVDDFKMGGKKHNLELMWKELGKHLDLEPPVPLHNNVYLGCGQSEIPTSSIRDIINKKREFYNDVLSGQNKGTEADRGPSPDKVVGINPPSSVSNPKPKKNKKKAAQKMESTVAEATAAASINKLLATPLQAEHNIRSWQYDMGGHAEQCVERYLELAKVPRSALKHVTTPCIDDHLLTPDDFTTKGRLSNDCSKIVLKALYLARMNRLDCLWAVNSLAREVTRWNTACDKRLHRLMCYINTTKDHIQACYVGDEAKDIQICMFVDASFAGDLNDSKSTTGACLYLIGPNTCVPITWICKKQGATSHSSTEAEVIAMETAMRIEGIPILTLWEQVIDVFSPEAKVPKKRQKFQTAGPKMNNTMDILTNVDFVPQGMPSHSGRAVLVIFEDNDAVIKMTIKGRSPTMRHLARVHRVNLDWLLERIREDPGIFLKYVNTKSQIADILTKGTFTEAQWKSLLELSQTVTRKPKIKNLTGNNGGQSAKQTKEKPQNTAMVAIVLDLGLQLGAGTQITQELSREDTVPNCPGSKTMQNKTYELARPGTGTPEIAPIPGGGCVSTKPRQPITLKANPNTDTSEAGALSCRFMGSRAGTLFRRGIYGSSAGMMFSIIAILQNSSQAACVRAATRISNERPPLSHAQAR